MHVWHVVFSSEEKISQVSINHNQCYITNLCYKIIIEQDGRKALQAQYNVYKYSFSHLKQGTFKL